MMILPDGEFQDIENIDQIDNEDFLPNEVEFQDINVDDNDDDLAEFVSEVQEEPVDEETAVEEAQEPEVGAAKEDKMMMKKMM